MLIEDGTGSGKKAAVNLRNHLVSTAITIQDEVFVALESSLSFSLSTGQLTIPASFSGPVLLLQNLDSAQDIVAVSAAAIIDLPSAGASLSAFRNPVVGTLAANAPKTPLNLNFEAGVKANVVAEIWDNATGLAGITGITAVTDGTFGPAPFPGSGQLGGNNAILGQNDVLTLNITSGAAGFEASVSVTFYFDTTGAK